MRGLVAHGIHAARGEPPRIRIADVTDVGLDVGAPPGWPRPVVRDEGVEHDDVVAAVDERVDDVGAHEATTAGDEDPHASEAAAATTTDRSRGRWAANTSNTVSWSTAATSGRSSTPASKSVTRPTAA